MFSGGAPFFSKVWMAISLICVSDVTCGAQITFKCFRNVYTTSSIVEWLRLFLDLYFGVVDHQFSRWCKLLASPAQCSSQARLDDDMHSSHYSFSGRGDLKGFIHFMTGYHIESDLVSSLYWGTRWSMVKLAKSVLTKTILQLRKRHFNVIVRISRRITIHLRFCVAAVFNLSQDIPFLALILSSLWLSSTVSGI